MHLNIPSQLLDLSPGETVTKRNLFDLIQFSKVEGSSYWEGQDWLIGNTPQQGINWVGILPNCRAVLIKVKHGSYANDGWGDDSRTSYQYSFKAREGKISYTEKANRVLADQPDYMYPILLFTEAENRWNYEGNFFVSGIRGDHVMLERVTTSDQSKHSKRSRAITFSPSGMDDGSSIASLLDDDRITKTERVQLIKARTGQGLFRSRVIRIERSCRVTGIADLRFLTASHIKPWSKSTNSEKLDGSNGLLLTPNVDRLFDKGYITFEDNGLLRISPWLPIDVLLSWGLNTPLPPKPLTKQQQFYMAHHRASVFRS